jgi:predicted metal-dependent phosphoesterase TrpH
MSSFDDLKLRFDYPPRHGRVDWHCHSTYSDGLDTPTQLVRLAKRAGLSEIALTDHDNVSGVPEARRAGRKFGVNVVAGVEFNTTDRIRGVIARPHVLGLGLKPGAPHVRSVLARLQRQRENRSRSSVQALQNLGYKITFAEVKGHAKGTVGRPALARALLARKENRALLKRAYNLGREPRVSDVFDHLIYRGGPGYGRGRGEFLLSPHQAFKLIRADGGLPVIAHPLICEIENGLVQLPVEKLREYARAGLGGVEVYYNSQATPKLNNARVRERWARLCRDLHLARTGGGDHHGVGSLALQGHDLGRIPFP